MIFSVHPNTISMCRNENLMDQVGQYYTNVTGPLAKVSGHGPQGQCVCQALRTQRYIADTFGGDSYQAEIMQGSNTPRFRSLTSFSRMVKIRDQVVKKWQPNNPGPKQREEFG